jgi:aminocarboxymuconate-semialdehyde decarboxylase
MCHRVGGTAEVMIDGKAFRRIDSRSWAAERRIADMEEADVTRQVLSPMPELLSYWFDSAAGLAMCRHMNESIAEVVAGHPDSFSGMGIVPLQDPALAASELAAIRSLGLCGVEVGSNVNGSYLGEARFSEFLAEMERLDLALFVHALHPIGADRLDGFRELIPFSAFPLDTALCAMTLIRAGIPDRFPRLRIGFSHGGGAIIPLAHRLGKGAEVTGNFDGVLNKRPVDYAREFYFDNLVYDPGYLAYLAGEFAPGRVFCGTDYPYLIMEVDPAGAISAAQVVDDESIRWQAAKAFLKLQ